MKQSFYIRNWKWFVLGTLFLVTFICYFDRQMIGTAIDPIAKEFGLDNIQIGILLSAFLISYAIGHVFIGLFIDFIRNIRIFFMIMVLGWSVTTMFIFTVKDYSTLLWLRYLLGIWEAVNFPICLMIISRIFPANERSLAVGIFASGASIATLLVPPFVVFISNTLNWRYAFGLGGAASLLWIIPWLIIFRKPEEKIEQWNNYYTSLTPRTSLLLNLKNSINGYFEVLSKPGFWGVVLLGIGITPSLYFATQWLPRFLTQSFDIPYDQSLSAKLSIIYFMQDAGLWIGGALVLILAGKGLSVMNSRKIVMVIAFLAIISNLFVPFVQSVQGCVIALCINVFGIGAFLGNQHAFKQDLVKGKVAAVAALDGFIEMVFTWFFIKKIGVITEVSGDFTIVFMIMAALAFFSISVVFLFLKPKWVVIS